MKENLFFRLWFYFRQGWGTYFAFLFAAVNTLTVTYYLAIEKYHFLKQIFPSILEYTLAVTLVGVPLLVFVGYVHFKKSKSFKAEADIGLESNPHSKRLLNNTEEILQLTMMLTKILIKFSKDEKLSETEIKKFEQLQTSLEKYIENKTFRG